MTKEETTMVDNNTTQPVVPATPITPLPVPPAGVPRVPVTLFNVWTWNSPVIPQFYWNVYSAEQRIKEICKQIGKISAYLDYSSAKINEANVDMAEQINKINTNIQAQIDAITKQLTSEVTRLEGLISDVKKQHAKDVTSLQSNIDKETNARTAADAKLTADLSAETKAREDGDAQLHTELTAETTNRTDADTALHTELSNETKARTDADTAFDGRLTTETTERTSADTALGKRIDAGDAATAKVASDLAAETTAREAADADLQSDLETETDGRKAADADLQAKLTAETTARGEAIASLTTRVANEESARQAEDTALGNRIDQATTKIEENATKISDETAARTNADAEINATVATKITRDDLVAGDHITLTKGENNKLTIGSSFTADFAALQSAVDGLTASLASETDERRHDDATLQAAVDARLERGKLLAGEGITVVNDPDKSTVTVSADVTQAELDAVKNTADAALKTVSVGDGLTGAGTAAAPLTVAPATAEKLGGVKVGSGLAVAADGTLSATAQGGSGLTAVAHDGSLSGEGTAEAPLAVAHGGSLELSENGLGVRVGTGLARTSSGVALSPATASTLGGVKPGEGLAVAADGTLSATAQGGSGLTAVAHDGSLSGEGTAEAPLAVAHGGSLELSENGLGVRVGTGLARTSSGVALSPATASTLGGVKPGEGLAVAADGTLSVAPSAMGLSSVAHDASLTGNGDSATPLGVATAASGGLSVHADGEGAGLSVNAGEGLSVNGDNEIVAEVTQAKLDAVADKAEAANTAADEAKTAAEAAKKYEAISVRLTIPTQLLSAEKTTIHYKWTGEKSIVVPEGYTYIVGVTGANFDTASGLCSVDTKFDYSKTTSTSIVLSSFVLDAQYTGEAITTNKVTFTLFLAKAGLAYQDVNITN